MPLSSLSIELIGIAIASVVLVIVCVVVYNTTRDKTAVEVSKTIIDKDIPPTPDFNPLAPTLTCLPTGVSNDALVQCTSQSQCTSCIETPGNAEMSCAIITSDSGVLNNDGTFVTPFKVNVSVDVTEDETVQCSGHGSMQKGKCVCDGDLAAGDTVIYSGDACELQTIYINKPGNYCLPGYVNVCDDATSDVIFGDKK